MTDPAADQSRPGPSSLIAALDRLPAAERERCLRLREAIQATPAGTTVMHLAIFHGLSRRDVERACKILTYKGLIRRRQFRGDRVVWMDHHGWPRVLLPSELTVRRSILGVLKKTEPMAETVLARNVFGNLGNYGAPTSVMVPLIQRVLESMRTEGRLTCLDTLRQDGPRLVQERLWLRRSSGRKSGVV